MYSVPVVPVGHLGHPDMEPKASSYLFTGCSGWLLGVQGLSESVGGSLASPHGLEQMGLREEGRHHLRQESPAGVPAPNPEIDGPADCACKEERLELCAWCTPITPALQEAEARIESWRLAWAI